MADNVAMQSTTLASPAAGVSVATDDIGGHHYQNIKVSWGADGTATPVVLGSGFPVQPGTSTTWAISAAALPLPTGASTESTLAAVLAALSSIAVTGPLTDAQIRASALAVSAASLPLPAGAATQTTLASILAALGTTLAVSGPLTDAQIRATALAISAASLPLPSGAATEAKQDTGITSLQLLDDMIATIGSATPAKASLAAGTDGTNARALKTTAAGELQVTAAPATTPTVSTFTSLSSLQLVPASTTRKVLIMYVRPGGGDLYYRAGSATVSATDKSGTIKAGETGIFEHGEIGLEWTGILSAANTVEITVAS